MTLEDVLKEAREMATHEPARGWLAIGGVEDFIREAWSAAYETGKRDGAKEAAGRSHRVSDAWEDDG